MKNENRRSASIRTIESLLTANAEKVDILLKRRGGGGEVEVERLGGGGEEEQRDKELVEK